MKHGQNMFCGSLICWCHLRKNNFSCQNDRSPFNLERVNLHMELVIMKGNRPAYYKEHANKIIPINPLGLIVSSLHIRCDNIFKLCTLN